jgi:hypothetical protein
MTDTRGTAYQLALNIEHIRCLDVPGAARKQLDFIADDLTDLAVDIAGRDEVHRQFGRARRDLENWDIRTPTARIVNHD